jgi:DGQHR domain-containing protein
MANPITIPAISISQPIGEFFLCSIPASTLLKVTYSIPATMKREDGMFSSIWGSQRVKSKARFKQIGEYIDETGATFPNTIILSANYLEDGSYVGEEEIRWHARKNGNGCFILTIPTEKRLASIIDGQHRLEGFKYATKPERLDMDIPCAVYINLPREYQARIFATININQKRVDKSLAYELRL